MFEGLIDSIQPEAADQLQVLLADRWKVQLLLAKARQRRIAEASARIENVAVEGIGQLQARITPEAYHFWGQRLGYDCWADDAFRREFLRDNPEARVKCRGARSLTLLNKWGQPLNPKLQPTAGA